MAWTRCLPLCPGAGDSTLPFATFDMKLLLILFFALSVPVIALGYLMDRGAVVGRINGANGLPILACVAVSFLLSLVVAGVSVFVGGWWMPLWVLAGSVVYHLGGGALLVWRLQVLANRGRADR